MTTHRAFSLPAIAAVLVGLPVYWAFPEDLPVWRTIGIVTGWAGYGLILASLFLMIREVWLATVLGGLERMYRWHHVFGVIAYVALLCHPLALAIDVRDESAVLAWSLLDPRQQGWPARLGWVSLICMMIGLAFALSRRLAYGSWRWLHIGLAVSVVLAVIHLLLLGLADLLLWAPVLAMAFLIWRFARADFGLGAKPYVVTEVAHPGAKLVEVRMVALGVPMRAQPGQFVLAAFASEPQFHDIGEYHPFTLSEIAADGRISMAIKALGDHTHRLQAISAGCAARVQGPFGDFLMHHQDGSALWIAGGIGITPFLAKLRRDTVPAATRLIYLFRNTADAAYADELRELAGIHATLAIDIVATGDAWPDLERLLPPLAELAGRHCYLCGPQGLINGAVDVLRSRGVPTSHIHFERFDFR